MEHWAAYGAAFGAAVASGVAVLRTRNNSNSKLQASVKALEEKVERVEKEMSDASKEFSTYAEGTRKELSRLVEKVGLVTGEVNAIARRSRNDD